MHGLGEQAQGADRRAFDHAQGLVAVHDVQQFVAPAAQAVGLAQQFRDLFEHAVQARARFHARADAQGFTVRIDARGAAQGVASCMRSPATATPRYI
ncbi:hypothetical protein D9M69_570170 [compost metagenome]